MEDYRRVSRTFCRALDCGRPSSIPSAGASRFMPASAFPSLQKLNFGIMAPDVTSQVLSRMTAPKLHTLSLDAFDFNTGQAKSLLHLLHFCSVETFTRSIQQQACVARYPYPDGPSPAELNEFEQPVAELFQLLPPVCSPLKCLELCFYGTCFFDLSDDIVKTISQACPLLEVLELYWDEYCGVRLWSGDGWQSGLFDATALTFGCLQYLKTNCPRLRMVHIIELQGWSGIHTPRAQCSMDRASSYLGLHLGYTQCDFPDEIYTYLRSLWSHVDLQWANTGESQRESRWSSVRERFEEPT
ncbi:hypothetical protein CALVIDRAFT_36921 [Calocera viscosa TUFC12733]|uniref:Uncharacterized protein n=1 Tax=Calocera viscosa (strain TUFC12733) TaxID=1330018 RepID=A0A167NYL6_CALVF|nr:hypothetical protein CALVIDRAFT_36921 [Calocera viscosa TUFC12733]